MVAVQVKIWLQSRWKYGCNPSENIWNPGENMVAVQVKIFAIQVKIFAIQVKIWLQSRWKYDCNPGESMVANAIQVKIFGSSQTICRNSIIYNNSVFIFIIFGLICGWIFRTKCIPTFSLHVKVACDIHSMCIFIVYCELNICFEYLCPSVSASMVLAHNYNSELALMLDPV